MLGEPVGFDKILAIDEAHDLFSFWIAATRIQRRVDASMSSLLAIDTNAAVNSQ
jgi:hypothetical protein